MPQHRIILAFCGALLCVSAASLLYAAAPKPAEVADTLEQRLLACAACHGKQGEGTKKNEVYPRLAGKPDGYLYNQLLNFREGRRKYEVMNYMVSYLSDAYLQEIAQYYAKLGPPYPPPASGASAVVLARGEALVTHGDPSRNLPPCMACHGKSLTGMAPAIPGLLGLSPLYIGQQMGAWRVRHRRAKEPDCMAKIASLLGPEEISALAAWLAAQPAPTGALIPVQNWYAPSLTSNRETGLGDWEIDEVVDLLKTGVSARSAVFGPMATVVYDSLQYLTQTDLAAMAIYLKSQTRDDEPGPAQFKVPAAQAEAMVKQGSKLYEKHCAECHQRRGEGVPRIYPPLVNNEAILMRYPINAIRIVVNGGFPPGTQGNPRPYGMPPFSQDLNDEEIAAVVSYIRQSWGNHALPVSPAEVSSARGIPVD
jgi:cytochrome c553